jgi:hypothetical protein
MRRSNFALRLQPSLLEELRKAAELEGVALNQLINVAVAEKISALRTAEYFGKGATVPTARKPCGFSNALEREILLWRGTNFRRIGRRRKKQNGPPESPPDQPAECPRNECGNSKWQIAVGH